MTKDEYTEYVAQKIKEIVLLLNEGNRPDIENKAGGSAPDLCGPIILSMAVDVLQNLASGGRTNEKSLLRAGLVFFVRFLKRKVIPELIEFVLDDEKEDRHDVN